MKTFAIITIVALSLVTGDGAVSATAVAPFEEPQTPLEWELLERQRELLAQKGAPGEGVYVSEDGSFAVYGSSGGVVGTGRAPSLGRAAGGAGKALVILSGEGNPQKQANLEEDLAVMARVLDKSVEAAVGAPRRPRTAMGINVVFAPGGGMRNLYLDGYGALFLMRVNLPLVASPKAAEEPKEKPATDSTWDEARRELYGQPGGGRVIATAGEEYDAGKVDKLKDAILEALKTAANIRHLIPDEYVTVSIFGDGGVGDVRTIQKSRSDATTSGGGYGSSGSQNQKWTTRTVDITAREQGTMMTIRVKKSDIDAFAKGRLNLEEFRKRAIIATYHGGVDAGAANDFKGFGGGTFGKAGFGSGSGGFGGGGGGFGMSDSFGGSSRRQSTTSDSKK